MLEWNRRESTREGERRARVGDLEAAGVAGAEPQQGAAVRDLGQPAHIGCVPGSSVGIPANVLWGQGLRAGHQVHDLPLHAGQPLKVPCGLLGVQRLRCRGCRRARAPRCQGSMSRGAAFTGADAFQVILCYSTMVSKPQCAARAMAAEEPAPLFSPELFTFCKALPKVELVSQECKAAGICAHITHSFFCRRLPPPPLRASLCAPLPTPAAACPSQWFHSAIHHGVSVGQMQAAVAQAPLT